MALYPAAIIKSINTALFSGSHSPFSGLILVDEVFVGDLVIFLEGPMLGFWSSSDMHSEDDRFIVIISEVSDVVDSTLMTDLSIWASMVIGRCVRNRMTKLADQILDTVSYRRTQAWLLGQVPD